MGLDLDIIGKGGVQFFGTISSSISHEIKNVLAVLNENAGLLDDLALMAEKGTPFDNERIRKIAGSMKNQIQRADLITINLNRLAHSVDEFLGRVNVSDILELVVSLSGRFADMKGIKLVPLNNPGKVHITTNPFLLEYLIYCFVDFSMNAAGEEKTVEISVEEKEKGAQIKFTGLQGLTSKVPNTFPSEIEDALLRTVHAEFGTDGDEQIIIILPEKI